MNLPASWEGNELENVAPESETSETAASRNSINTLRELVLRLLCEVQSINEVNTLSIENGFDFYEEVSRFEIELINRALLQTGGHQVRAAKLLNLKVTTLNSKIKHYNICLVDCTYSYPVSQNSEMETRRRA